MVLFSILYYFVLQETSLLHEGELIWRLSKNKLVDVQVLLCSNYLFLLSKDSTSGHLILKYRTNPVTDVQLLPVLHVNEISAKAVANDKLAFFIVSTGHNLVYEFVAKSVAERDQWVSVVARCNAEYEQVATGNAFDGALKVLNRLAEKSEKTVVISNEPGPDRSLISKENVEKLTQLKEAVEKQLAIVNKKPNIFAKLSRRVRPSTRAANTVVKTVN